MAEYGPLKSRSFSTLTKNLYPGLTMIVGWMFRFLRVTSNSDLADLLPDRLPYLLPIAGLRENR